MECQSQKTKLAENMKRIGFLRVLNEENAVIPCSLSVAPVLGPRCGALGGYG